MKRFSDRHGLTTVSELNVTPLLDLAFVLLIIFMITTPLMEKSVDVVLPSSEAAKNAPPPDAVQTVVLHHDERITLNGDAIDPAELEKTLHGMRESRPEIAVVIRADKDLPVQRLVTVMDAVQHARITKVGVVTQPEQP